MLRYASKNGSCPVLVTEVPHFFPIGVSGFKNLNVCFGCLLWLWSARSEFIARFVVSSLWTGTGFIVSFMCRLLLKLQFLAL